MVVHLMRIIAGTAKGRRLQGPMGLVTRPMTDRAKEGLFSAIASDVGGAAVLDLYAGSGSLGLEALSRGAESAVFVEQDREAIETLRANIGSLEIGGLVEASTVGRFLSGFDVGARFDLVFVDPPYALGADEISAILRSLLRWLGTDPLIVLHRRAGEPPITVDGLTLEADRRYGTTHIWRYRVPNREPQKAVQ